MKVGTLQVVVSNGTDEATLATVPVWLEQNEGKRPRWTFGSKRSSATVPVPLGIDKVSAFVLQTGKGGPVRIDLRDGRTNDAPVKDKDGKAVLGKDGAPKVRPGKAKRHGSATVKVGKETWTVHPQVSQSAGGDLSLFIRGTEGEAPEVQVDADALAALFG